MNTIIRLIREHKIGGATIGDKSEWYYYNIENCRFLEIDGEALDEDGYIDSLLVAYNSLEFAEYYDVMLHPPTHDQPCCSIAINANDSVTPWERVAAVAEECYHNISSPSKFVILDVVA